MFELSSQATSAGSKVAIEWAKLEAQGFEPAEVPRKPLDQLSEPELSYLRAYQHFEVIVQQCKVSGVRIPLRYATFHATGGSSNPGVLPPTISMVALALLVASLMLISMSAVEVNSSTLPLIAVSAGLVALGWDRVWVFCEYAAAQVRSKRPKPSR